MLLDLYKINIADILKGDELFFCCRLCKRLFERREKAATNLKSIENELLIQSNNLIRSESRLDEEEEVSAKRFCSAESSELIEQRNNCMQPRQSTPTRRVLKPVPFSHESPWLSPVQQERVVPITSSKSDVAVKVRQYNICRNAFWFCHLIFY